MTDTAASTPTDLAAFIEGLPKCELHVHLEGTLAPDLKLALAQRNGLDIGQTTVEEVEATYQFDSLTSFLAVYYPAMGVLVTAEDFSDLAYAYLAKAASLGVRYVEMFFDPQAHTGRGVPFSTVIQGYRQGIVRARAELGISGELILCFLRDLSAEFAMATLMEALPYKEWIIGIGLDSDERGNPPSKFAAVFARARQEGWQLTMHCDIDQEGSIEHIRQALQEIGVDRIDHGTNIVESPALVAEAKERGVGFTCCPVSNSFVTADMKADEIVSLLRDGVRVTVNSDDPAYFGGYMTENYAALAAHAGLDAGEVLALARNAFEVAWLTPRARDGYLAELDAYAARHGVTG
ncbi:adenosine deaminase [Aquihabitans sp. G128]|uniref:adenosine deaminase n=1 Tax=Aquihabitans sp. G128 TaxID=2849779 RepID=UPI001C224E8A|nr:adenosine deaminase [Aquihabitans sp. G128]QXC61638.1 adenosine deaminase [Aquihabitans sp. G128]